MEVWKAIPAYEGIYEISNFGNVRSLDRSCVYCDGRKTTRKGKQLKMNTNSDGYKQVQLCNGKKRKTVRVHRLVAEAFIPNPQNYNEVNHKDENKANNCVSNLEWCDHVYNSRYGTRCKRIAEKQSKPVNAYLQDDSNNVLRFKSMKEAAEFFGVSGETIRQAAKYGWKCRDHIIAQGTETVWQGEGFYFCR